MAAEPPRIQRIGGDLSSGGVFVTGGTGFVGDRLVAALLARGRSVRGLARPTSERPASAERLEWVTGDILDRDSLRRGLAGCTEVFHLAAYAKNWATDPLLFFRVNVEGARNVFEVAAEAGVRRIVYTSTVVVFGPTPRGVVGNEEMPRATPRFLTEYEEGKAVAEKEALRAGASPTRRRWWSSGRRLGESWGTRRCRGRRPASSRSTRRARPSPRRRPSS